MENYRPTLDWRCSSSMKKREREKREIASYKSRKSRRIKGIYHYPSPINQPNTSFFTKFPFDFPRISNYPKLIALQFPQLSNSVHLARSIIHSRLKNDQMEKSFRSVPRERMMISLERMVVRHPPRRATLPLPMLFTVCASVSK